MTSQAATMLEMEFLLTLGRHRGKHVKTADLVNGLGWTEETREVCSQSCRRSVSSHEMEAIAFAVRAP